MTSRWGYPDGISPKGGWFSRPSTRGRYSIRVSRPECQICFIIPSKPHLVKYQ